MNARLGLRSVGRYYRPLNPIASTASACAAANLCGPFTRQQVIALVWRAKKIRVQYTVNYTISAPTEEDPQATEPKTSTFNVEGLRIIGGEINYTPAEVRNLFVNEANYYGQAIFSNSTDATAYWSFYVDSFSLRLDENGGYWVAYGPGAVGDSTAPGVRFADSPADQGHVDFTADLTLLGATIPMKFRTYSGVYVSVESATATVTISEWFPYATTAGAPAWNTSTGAPINGGPGA